MVSPRSLVLLVAATVVYAQEMSSLKPCAVECYNRALADFARFGCASAADVRCMCQKPDWSFSIRDCAAAACEPGYADTVTAAANALCATATVAPPTPSQTSTPPATSAPSTTTPAPASSSASSSLSSTTSAPSTAAKLTSSSSTSSPTSSATKSASTSSSPTASRAPASSTSAVAAPVSSNQGMTTATKIGLGVGLTAAVAALIGAVIFFLIRRRQNKRVPAGPKHWKISDPVPANSGRGYAQVNHSYETGLSELEMKSRRYEDMVPRQQPRHMV